MFYSLKSWPCTSMCNHKNLQAHRAPCPPRDTKHAVTSLKLHHHYSLEIIFFGKVCVYSAMRKRCGTAFSRIVAAASHCKIFVIWIFPHFRIVTLLRRVDVRGSPCSASQRVGLLLCRTGCFKGMNELSQVILCTSFPCKSRLISTTNQGEWEQLLLAAIQKFCIH